MSVNLSFANEDDDLRLFKGRMPKVVERYAQQLSPVSHPKQRSGSLGAIEVGAVRTNPFLLKDKNFSEDGKGRHKILIVKNNKFNHFQYGIDNESLSDDCDVSDGVLCADIAVSKKSPKVLIRPSESTDNTFSFDGNNNTTPVKYCRKSSYQFSSDLFSWYSDCPKTTKSASLPRKLPPPPASPRSSRRLSPPGNSNKVSQRNKIFGSQRESTTGTPTSINTVNNTSTAINGCCDTKKSPSIDSHHSNLKTVSSSTGTRSAPQSPNKSATLPPSHRLTPTRGACSLPESASKSTPKSQPSSPKSNVRRRASLLVTPSSLRSPSGKRKPGFYKSFGPSDTLKTTEFKGQGSNGSSVKHKNSISSKKKSEWKPIDPTMTNYEGYYPDESSDSEVTEPSSGQGEKHQKSFDSVVFSVLKVTPEDFASQLTLLDLDAFKAIQPQELTGCGWIKKDKAKTSPNVVQMTQRFNNTSFYVIDEILHAQTLKIRAEIVTHFIRIAKKLHELNNLHSLMAIISSLNSSPIHRLAKTWTLVNKHYRATYERLLCLVSEDNNRKNLRKHIEGIKLPCIPYLGLYLADMIFVDSAHPDTGGLESHERTNKMNNILRILAEFQQSSYEHLREIPHIKNFLQSVKYIEELQRFAEEENYKRSLQIEPNQQTTPMRQATSREELTVPDPTLPRRSMTPPSQQLFKPGHRKSHSLGRDIRPRTDPAKLNKRRSFARLKPRDFPAACNGPSYPLPTLHRVQSSPEQSGSLPRNTQPPRRQPLTMTTSLLDDSIISPGTQPPTLNFSSSIGSSRSNSGSEVSDDTSWNGVSASDGRLELGRPLFEGVLRRKTVLKKGRKPTMPSWTKYWVCVHKSQLVFFAAKALKAYDRHHFKQNPCKMITIREWMVLRSDDFSKLDSFQLSNPNQGDIYRFQCDSKEVALVWVNTIQEAIKGNSPPEKDLINLDDS